MTDPGPQWLDAECARLLSEPPSQDRLHHADLLGSRVAESSAQLRDLVTAFLQAASHQWATLPAVGDRQATHLRAATLLHSVQELLAAAIDGYHQRIGTELSTQDSQRAEFLNDLLTGRADPVRLAQRAHRYGIRLSGNHMVIAVRTETLTDAVVHELDATLAARYGAGNVLTAPRDRQLICISSGGLRGVTAEIAHQLLRLLGAGTWQIGVGRAHPGLQGLTTSLDEAVNALDLAEKLDFTAPVLHAADLLVFPVLLRDRDAIVDLVATVLGPLVDARGGAQPYLDTLTALFDNQGNYTATARQMHLSVRAVTYRLDRIQALTGYHPNEPTQRFTLHTAVLGARLLGWPDCNKET